MSVLNKITQGQRTQALRSDMNLKSLLRGMASGTSRSSWVREIEWKGRTKCSANPGWEAGSPGSSEFLHPVDACLASVAKIKK